jgi:hypothetical protein
MMFIMSSSLWLLFSTLVFVSCTEQNRQKEVFAARNDIRFGKRFFSIVIKEDGTAYVIKGIGSSYLDPLEVESADTSAVFTVDSSSIYFRHIRKLEENPSLKSNVSGGARAEIYYKKKKVYDSYHWDGTFWEMFRPIMNQLPKGFSPFRVNEKPFG